MGILKKIFPVLLQLFVMAMTLPVAGEEACLNNNVESIAEPDVLCKATECSKSSPCEKLCCDDSGADCCLFSYLGHTEGRWLDNREGYTTLGLFSQFSTLGSSDFFTLVDIRAHIFNDGKVAANVGTGLRYFNREDSRVFGVNVFYDFREAYWHRKFNQIGVGLEMLSPCWEVRLNGYFPIGRRWGHSSTRKFDCSSSEICATCREKRFAMGGGDFEIGRWLCRSPCDCLEFYAGIGPYFYLPKDHKHVYGGQIRLLANIGPYVTLEARGGYDTVYHGLGQGTILLNIPFNCLCKSGKDACQEDCCSWDIPCERIVRQEIIALSKKNCCWTWDWDSQE